MAHVVVSLLLVCLEASLSSYSFQFCLNNYALYSAKTFLVLFFTLDVCFNFCFINSHHFVMGISLTFPPNIWFCWVFLPMLQALRSFMWCFVDTGIRLHTIIPVFFVYMLDVKVLAYCLV